MDIYLVRHGEADGNRDGHIPEPGAHLNSTGIEQAKKAAEALREIHFDKIYSSPYIRAKETAEYINQYHNHEHIIIDHRLSEINVSSWIGKSSHEYKEERAKCPDGWFNYKRGEDESFVMAYQRVRGFYDDILRLNKNKEIKVLIITHSDIIKSLLLLLLDLDVDTAKKIKIENCGILHFRYNENPYYKGFELVHSLLVAHKENPENISEGKPEMEETGQEIKLSEDISGGMGMFG